MSWCTYSFNVDFKGVESVLCARSDAFLEELDTRLFKEVLNRWLCNLAIVCKSVGLDPSFHVLWVVVCAENLLLRKVSDSFDQVLVAAIENNHTAREDAVIFLMLVEAR